MYCNIYREASVNGYISLKGLSLVSRSTTQNACVSPNGNNNVGIEPVLQPPKPVLQLLLEDGALAILTDEKERRYECLVLKTDLCFCVVLD